MWGTPVELRHDTWDTRVLRFGHPEYMTYYMTYPEYMTYYKCLPPHYSNATEQVKETGRCAVPVEMSDAVHFDFS